ncbi:MAG: helicase C-terminal domain-containing protein, partial [Nitrospirota bacterium]
KQALLFLDKELPPPLKGNNDDFQQKSLEKIEGLIAASKGRALVLFTSYNHLRYAVENINITYPSKSQGDMPPSRLIQWFKKTDNAVLLATATFWQGIDIKGEKLSLVIIVKMPFGSPGDPVYDERCRRLGERWFNDLALPSAILMLRQGFGRLIRSVDDYGVVAVLDTRLVTSSYGKTIISSLPEMDVVHSIEDVKRFFDSIPVFSESHAPIYKKRARRDRAEAGGNKISLVAALGNSKDPSVIPELINFTNSENGSERRLAASALGKLARFKPEIYEAVEALENLLNDEKPQVRQYAMKAIAKIGKVKHERLKAVIDNPLEKEYNVSLAKKLVHSKK